MDAFLLYNLRIMKKIYGLIFALFFVFHSSAYSQTELPEAWNGSWKGMTNLVWESGKIEPAEVQVQISSKPDSKIKLWKLVYKFPDRTETRDYELKPADDNSNHFILDEKNGFLIDTYLSNKVLYNQFTINGNLITTRFELQDKMILIELTMFDIRNPRLTKLTGGQFEVSSFTLKYTQKGSLTRQ